MCNKLDDDLGVARRLKESPFAFKFRANVAEIYQVAIVRNRDEPLRRIHTNGLRVQQRGVAGRRVARVPDGHIAVQLRQHFFGKDVGNKPHALDIREIRAIGSRNASRLLPAMLQCVKTKICLPSRVRMPVNRDNATFLPQLVILQRTRGGARKTYLRFLARNAFDQQTAHASTSS